MRISAHTAVFDHKSAALNDQIGKHDRELFFKAYMIWKEINRFDEAHLRATEMLMNCPNWTEAATGAAPGNWIAEFCKIAESEET